MYTFLKNEKPMPVFCGGFGVCATKLDFLKIHCCRSETDELHGPQQERIESSPSLWSNAVDEQP